VTQIAVYSQIIQNTKLQCGQSIQLLNVKLVVHHLTSGLYINVKKYPDNAVKNMQIGAIILKSTQNLLQYYLWKTVKKTHDYHFKYCSLIFIPDEFVV
jgi:hypothetical protein